MKLFYNIVVLLVINFVNAQVGINTTSPTEALDVDGNLRIRNLTKGTVVADVDGVVAISPIQVVAAGKVEASNSPSYSASGATVSRNGKGDYTITFDNELASANYVIVLTVMNCNGRCPGRANADKYDAPSATYYNQTTSSFDVLIGDSDNGASKAVAIDQEFMFVVYSF
ncbi:hypothetical protein [Flavobacterium sp.]|uniref:hypothetical protein n=1 Tax=Flavobacterium sp. TaxID=239 RepID=UPI003527DE47